MRFASFLVILFLSLTTWLPFNASAQVRIVEGPPVQLKIEEIGVAKGLSQGMIHGMDVDLKGYLWIATKDGLNRYDGHNFHVFRHDPQDTNSIASNYIRSLHVDDRGLIWVGTNANGLDLYDPAQMRFIHFGPGTNPAATSRIQSVARIISDPSGRVLIWDGTGEHCEIFAPSPGKDPTSIESWEVKSIDQLFKLHEDIPKPHIYNTIGFGAEGELLFGHDHKVYASYKDYASVWSPGQISNNKGFPVKTGSDPVQYFIDNRHRLFCITAAEKNLYKWDYQTDKFHVLAQLPKGYQVASNRTFVDQKDRIWSNGASYPLYRLDLQQGLLQRMDVTRFHFAGTSPPDFGIVCEDHHHNLWASTGGNGIIKITSRNDQFSRQFATSSRTMINLLVKDGFTNNLDDRLTNEQRKSLEDRFDIAGFMRFSEYAEDAQHQLWCVGIMHNMQQHLLIEIDPEQLTFSQYPIDMCPRPAEEASISIMFDHQNKLWIGGECDAGKAILIKVNDPKENSGESHEFPVEVIRNEHAFITNWYVTGSNHFWIGTKQGLFFFNQDAKQWKHFIADHLDTDALSHNHILSICPDPALPDKFLWIGTDGGGLNKMDMEREIFQHYNTDDDLPNNVIYAVQSDSRKNLWLSTNKGLSRFNPVTEEVWSFTVEDGLPGNEFNRTEYAKAPDGRLIFGGVEGLVSFNPDLFYETTAASPIIINRLKLSNKEITFTPISTGKSKDVYQLPAPIEHLQKLTFPYTERMITLGFTLLDFTNPSGNKYRYKLEGFHNEWIDAGELHEAVFTNLNPGSYTFLVSGRNSNNVWSDPAKLQLVIRSPWWATWWFRILIAAIFAVTIYAFYRYRLQQAMKLQHLRNRIAADLHDEIGSTLSSISLAGTVIQHKLNTKYPEVDGLLERINQNTQKMMEAMSDIVWAVNTKNDRFDQVMHRMKAFAIEILEPNDVTVHFDVSPGISQLQLDMQQRKNLYLIFKEVIHNAAKYAQCENVWVTLRFTHGHLRLEISDDGVGYEMQPVHDNHLNDIELNDSVKKMGGNGMQNMYHRASELKGKVKMQSSSGHGTKVVLTFPV